MTKNSLKNGPDELGYYGEGESAMGGMAVGETLMPALHELNLAFEDAIKDKAFLDEFAYYCKHYIGRPSPLYHAENLSNKLGVDMDQLSGDIMYLLKHDLVMIGAK